MIVEFSVSNFRSFYERQSLSFVASSDSSHASSHCINTGLKSIPRVLKTAGIFGPNSCGKSNLVMAIRTLRHFVVNSAWFSAAEFAKQFTPFGSGHANSEPTRFEIDVVIDSIRYQYSMAYSLERVVFESLLVYRRSKAQHWFVRKVDAISGEEQWKCFSPYLGGRREAWRKATRCSALFLTTAGHLESTSLVPLVNWFKHQLEAEIVADEQNIARLGRRLSDARFKMHILDSLHNAGFPIRDIRVSEPTEKEGTETPYIVRGLSIECRHDSSITLPVWLDLCDEGAGICRLVWLLQRLFDGNSHDRFTVIDDFHLSLHSLTARFLIESARSAQTSDSRAQLLFTSHDFTLMDLDLLRRDEIWLVSQDVDRASHVASIAHHGVRRHESLAKTYIQGRYGAVPAIGLPSIL